MAKKGEKIAGSKVGSATKTRTKKKAKVPFVIVHVKAGFNNTIVSVTDPSGNLISWCSSGKKGFRGKERSSSFAAIKTAEAAVLDAQRIVNCEECEARLDGPGSGRESAVRGAAKILRVVTIRDCTKLPHNGCRKRKK